jgi:hypothetical protein
VIFQFQTKISVLFVGDISEDIRAFLSLHIAGLRPHELDVHEFASHPFRLVWPPWRKKFARQTHALVPEFCGVQHVLP